MREKNTVRRGGGAVPPVVVLLALGILAHGVGCNRQGPGGGDPAPAVAESAVSDVAAAESAAQQQPSAGSPQSALPEVTAVFEKPLVVAQRPERPFEPTPPAPAESPALAPAEESPWRQGDRRDAERCLRFDARPTNVDTSRGVGPQVEVIVRAENSCPLVFEAARVGFRLSATTLDGFELCSAVGRFPGDLSAYGSAATPVYLPCDATRAAHYSVQLH
jgi:hypothetical protein